MIPAEGLGIKSSLHPVQREQEVKAVSQIKNVVSWQQSTTCDYQNVSLRHGTAWKHGQWKYKQWCVQTILTGVTQVGY